MFVLHLVIAYLVFMHRWKFQVLKRWLEFQHNPHNFLNTDRPKTAQRKRANEIFEKLTRNVHAQLLAAKSVIVSRKNKYFASKIPVSYTKPWINLCLKPACEKVRLATINNSQQKSDCENHSLTRNSGVRFGIPFAYCCAYHRKMLRSSSYLW